MQKAEEVFCLKYCPHGGACSRVPGHDGLHNTKSPLSPERPYCCDFSNEEVVSKQEADLIFLLKSPFNDELNKFIIENS